MKSDERIKHEELKRGTGSESKTSILIEDNQRYEKQAKKDTLIGAVRCYLVCFSKF